MYVYIELLHEMMFGLFDYYDSFGSSIFDGVNIPHDSLHTWHSNIEYRISNWYIFWKLPDNNGWPP